MLFFEANPTRDRARVCMFMRERIDAHVCTRKHVHTQTTGGISLHLRAVIGFRGIARKLRD